MTGHERLALVAASETAARAAAASSLGEGLGLTFCPFGTVYERQSVSRRGSRELLAALCGDRVGGGVRSVGAGAVGDGRRGGQRGGSGRRAPAPAQLPGVSRDGARAAPL